MIRRLRGLALLALLCPVAASAAPAGKVSVCHQTGNGGAHVISVSQNAVAAHVGHGDHVVGAEVCDGIDNDCDGTVDEGIAPVPTTCGVGACAAAGELACVDGALVDSCVPGAPAPEVCDGIDDDCDGAPDNGIAPVPSTCGTGACAASGQQVCVAGALVDTCTPGPASAETCDGIDNDCDGAVDDGINPVPTTCGVGACASAGALVCAGGALVDTCTPGAPYAEVCTDGVDNDCDGAVDDGCGAVFSEDFPPGDRSAEWDVFESELSASAVYNQVQVFSDTNAGYTCTGPEANTICQAIRTQTNEMCVFVSPVVVTCGGNVWGVGTCGGTEITVNTPACTCSSNGTALRPEFDAACGGPNYVWGAVNGYTCSSDATTLSVICSE